MSSAPPRGSHSDPSTPLSPSAVPKDRPPGPNIIWEHSGPKIPWILGWLIETELLLGKSSVGEKPPSSASLPENKHPLSPGGQAHPSSSPWDPLPLQSPPNSVRTRSLAKLGGAPPQAPAMHSGSLGTVACPRALKAQPSPHRGWQPAGSANLQGVTGRGHGRMEGGMDGYSHRAPKPAAHTIHPAPWLPSRAVGAARSRRTIPFAFLPPSCPARQAAEERSPAQLLAELRINAFKSLISLLSPALAVRWAFFCMRN